MIKFDIAMGCDHAGYELKETLKSWMEEMGRKIMDYGTFSADSVDYPDFIHPVANLIETKQARFGIIICGSGNGAAITANKHQGIRAALCWNPELAMLARQHNDANIISLPARYISLEEAKEILQAFFRADFEGGRHVRRIEKIPVK